MKFQLKTLLLCLLCSTSTLQAEEDQPTKPPEKPNIPVIEEPISCQVPGGVSCEGRCYQMLQSGSDWKVEYVQIFAVHNNRVVGKTDPLDMGSANMADFRSDLTNAQEDLIIDAVEMIDLDPNDGFSPDYAGIYDEIVKGLSRVFPEVNRKPGQSSVIVASKKDCPDKTCGCDYGEYPSLNQGNKVARTIYFNRYVPVLNEALSYHINWKVTFKGYDRVYWGGQCRYYF